MQFKSERHAVPSETVMQIQSESACSSSGICITLFWYLYFIKIRRYLRLYKSISDCKICRCYTLSLRIQSICGSTYGYYKERLPVSEKTLYQIILPIIIHNEVFYAYYNESWLKAKVTDVLKAIVSESSKELPITS